MYKEIVQGRLSTDLKVLFYFDKLALVYFFYIISLKKLKRNEKIYVCIFFVMTFLKFSKMDIMQLFVGCVLILWIKRKLNVRHIVILSCLIFALITFIHLFRAKDSNKGSVIDGISQMLAIYFLSPIKAFDLIVNQNIHFEKYQTFILLDRILVKIFSIKTNISCDTFDGWVYVPFPTNVYTCLWRFYSDFGILGVIFFGYLLGFSWTLLFEKRNKPVFQLIYFTLSYILVFQFFSDIIFGFTSQIIQVVILTILLFHLKNNRGLRQDCINVFSIKKRKCNEC